MCFAYKFTGKERDAESGLDYVAARYYASTMGRFTSADPPQFNELRLINPQRWNMYSYAPNKHRSWSNGRSKGTCPLFGPCYKGPPLPPSCASQAVNQLSFAADALGAIPGEGQFLAGTQLAAAGVGYVNRLATNDAPGAAGSVLGGQATLVGAAAESFGGYITQNSSGSWKSLQCRYGCA